MHGRSRRTRAWQGHARARGHTTRMRMATNRAGILLAIMRPGQLKTYNCIKSHPKIKVAGSKMYKYIELHSTVKGGFLAF